VLVALLQTNAFATSHTLEEIVEKFNNSEVVEQFANYGYEMVAATNEYEPNILSVTLTTAEGSTTVSYELSGSILSYEYLVDNTLITAYFLADSIGQVNGYEDGKLLENFNLFLEEIHDYTVEDEGFEITENGDYYSVKMDIDKKVPLIDLSEFYLKPSDFDFLKEIVDENSVGNQTGKKSKLVYDVMIQEEENYIYIGEEDELTNSSYKSILSVLEVIYGQKVVDYFESIYPDYSYGNMILDGFTIETDVEMDLEEQPMFTGTEVVLVTVDNEYVKDEFLRTEYIGETIERGDKTITLDFTDNNTFKLGFFDLVSSSDIAFLFKYILEPIFIESNAELEDDTAYFNIENEKIVVGDKNNSVFKLVITDEGLEILSTNTNIKKTTAIAKHENVKAKEYEEGKSQDHFRYGNYNVTANIIYGNEVIEEATNYEFIEGANETYTIGKEGITFKINADYSLFENGGKVFVDDKETKDFTSKSGSTIITLSKEYMSSLSEGEHTLKVAFNNGAIATTQFTVAKAEETLATEETVTSNPKTGDNIMITISIFAIATLGAYTTLRINRNCKMRKH